MDTKEKGIPEEVQVEEPEEMGAMSAEEAGDTRELGYHHHKCTMGLFTELISHQFVFGIGEVRLLVAVIVARPAVGH
ncbi:hypothetical protein EYF80_001407 [Liparis tanakae]|uniref:Uncharacterized protein n=1 Tax=Liparis tanakae TaxID=230148 RepID=A0A4Z2JDU5_9TELE|nr:hypothetical protein EYF80_001407 [Liparis tanakae]